MHKTLLQQPELPLWGAQDEFPVPAGDARRILLGDRIVPYVLRRSRRRTIGLTVDRAGLRVGAPIRASQREVESLILKHGQWILAKLREWVGRDLRPGLKVVDGAELPILGEAVTLRLEVGTNRAVWELPLLRLQLRPDARAADVLERALRARARELFAERLAIHAEVMRLPVPSLALSSARTRWGSCNRETGIRLNWRLIHCPLPLVDYVVVHELAHLRQMNHSPRFWAEVEAVVPDYRELRRELRSLSERLPVIQER